MIRLFDPIGAATEQTGKVLFQPFDIGKWFALGLSAWLASFLTGIGGASFNGNFGNGFGKSGSSSDAVNLFSRIEMSVWIAIIAGIFLVVILLSLLFIWLGARGQFMLLQNVLRNESLVKAPWKRWRREANSLFVVHALVQLAIWLSLAALVIIGLVAYYPDLAGRQMRPFAAYVPLIVGFVVWLGFCIGLGLAMLFLIDFGVVWMYRNGGTAWAALRKVGVLATHNPVDFIVYAVIRIVMTFVFALAALMAGCLTCCLGFIPYLGAVLTLPLSVFRVWYSVECFAQFGSEFDARLGPQNPPAELI